MQTLSTTASLTPVLALIRPIAQLSGLFHDLGKGTRRFQHKLRHAIDTGKSLGDPIRHEVISVLLAQPLYRALDDMTSVSEVQPWCDTHLSASLLRFHALGQTRAVSSSHAIAQQLMGLFDRSAWERQQLDSTAMLWLVLSHHRLPEGRHCDIQGMIPSIDYAGFERAHYFLKITESAGSLADTGASTQNAEAFNENLTLAHLDAQPWHDPTWCQAVWDCHTQIKAALALAQDHLPINALTDRPEFSSALAFMARSALVYADYIASIEKRVSDTQSNSTGIYANTATVDHRMHLADTLTDHLLAVGKKTGVYFDDLFSGSSCFTDQMPSLSADQRQAALPGLTDSSSDPRYQWQDRVRDTLLPRRSNAPFFASVMGKTGSGKTRTNIMLMHTLRETLRFSCAIGLRSLVKQTHAAYSEPMIGLGDEHMAFLIGEAQEGAQSVHAELHGTGNDAIEDDKALIGDYQITGASQGRAPAHPLTQLFEYKKQRALISHPVQIMTVDHIMPGASLGRSGELKLLLHLMGTDIVLDEIDDYPVRSQTALMRMAFISGLFGRAFVLSSATATPIIQKAFFSAWHAGLRQHQMLFEVSHWSAQAHAYLVSHVPGCEVTAVDLGEGTEHFDTACDSFIDQVVQEAKSAGQHRHRIDLISMEQPHDDEEPGGRLYGRKGHLNARQHQQLVDTIKAAHQAHGVSAEGVRLSSGFVRFNNVSSAQHLALALNQWADPEVQVVPICYHSAFIQGHRMELEALLSSVNNRKAANGVSGDQVIFQHPFIRQVMAEAQAAGKREVILVLCTTNIIEVGRDHDYDWAILEPSSTRSMVQSAGRVWRHRIKHLVQGVSNVWLLPMTVRALSSRQRSDWQDEATAQRVWSRHGIEDDVVNRKPIVTVGYPLTRPVHTALERMGVCLNGVHKPLAPGFARFSRPTARKIKPLLASGVLWQAMIEQGGVVHAGLCLSIPTEIAGAVMSSLEIAQQVIHLQGVWPEHERMAHVLPSGLSYSQVSAARLCGNHAKRRRLREEHDGFSLFYSSEACAVDERGQMGDTWWAVDKRGEVAQAGMKMGQAASGTLFKPATLEAMQLGNPELSERLLTTLALRQDQYQKLYEFKYVPGIGLCRQ